MLHFMRINLCLLCFVFSSWTTALIRDPFFPVTPFFISKPLQNIWIPVYFANAAQIAHFLTQPTAALLSAQGKINYDVRTNQLWVMDDAAHISRIRTIAAHLDTPGQQFLIKAKIVMIDRGYQKALGLMFHTENHAQTSVTPLNIAMPTNAQGNGEFDFSIAKLAGEHVLEMQISALEQAGHATIISTPSLMTLNNQAAVIESGAEVPYQETTFSGGTSVRFKKAVLRLKVTPQTLPNHAMLLHIALNQDKVSALTVKGVPAIQTQQITTQVIAHDHQTIALGGILENVRAKQIDSIPIVDQLPVIGKLFQHHTTQNKQQMLLIFITPTLISPNEARA